MVATGTPPTIYEDRATVGPSSARRRAVAIAVAAVWVAVGALSLFAPDLVSGTEQERVPIAGLSSWLWGGLATGLILLAGAVGRDAPDAAWSTFAAIIVTMWAVVGVAGVWSPELVTGTDPTRVPLAAILAPIAGAIGTAFVCVYAAGSGPADR
ncbi:MAG: hypothetical protein ACXWZF_06275 [Actinomycetota bacterium]